MALQTDDCDIRDVRMWTEFGGNGDYYINLVEYNKPMFGAKSAAVSIHTRVSMSGGGATTEVRLAVAALYRAMEAAGLNKHPKDD